ncbi:CAP Gly-rich domain-containing protein, partial [Cantharellus anzutake]
MGVGSRLSHSGSLGTVCYTGEVERTKGTWLGVEWDDPNRGKHSGEHNGKVYFQCSIPGAGSFIRQTAETSFGVTFRRALEDKYLSGLNAHEEKLAPNTAEVFLLGTIEIEAPNFDRVRQKFSRIEKLKELSLDGEGVSSIEADDELRRWCRNVQGLNLSKNLFTGWNSILVAMSFLPALKSLSLDRNRFQTLTSPLPETSSRVTELRLNDTLMSWEELPYIAPAFPKLEALQLGFNRLQRLGPWKLSSSLVSTLRLVFLDGNLLSDWVNITEAVSGITNLRH